MATKQLLSEEVVEDLKDYMANPKGFVLLVGKNGRGKSYAAMKVYEACTTYKLPHHDHDQAWFVNQADLNILFAESNEIYGSSMSLLKQGYTTKLLVIDDMGTRPPSPAFMDFLYAIVDKRWNERDKKATIITTNLDSARIRKDFGDAIFSRIASGRNYVVIGDDRRFTDLGF
jgi:DNA replication protein DnaC